MAITYPIAHPTAPGFSRFRWIPDNVVALDTNPFTLETDAYDWGGRRWAAEIEVATSERDQAADWQAFFNKLKGRFGTFNLGDPNGSTARGIATGTPLVNGASQTGEDLITDGWTINITNIMRAGDYIQLGSGATAQLHRVLTDVNSDGSGNVTLTIWPSLRSSPADNAAITVSNCKGLFRLADNAVPEDIDNALFYGFSFRAIEAL